MPRVNTLMSVIAYEMAIAKQNASAKGQFRNHRQEFFETYRENRDQFGEQWQSEGLSWDVAALLPCAGTSQSKH